MFPKLIDNSVPQKIHTALKGGLLPGFQGEGYDRILPHISCIFLPRIHYLQSFKKVSVVLLVSTEIISIPEEIFKHTESECLSEAPRPRKKIYRCLFIEKLFNKKSLVNKVISVIYYSTEIFISHRERFELHTIPPLYAL